MSNFPFSACVTVLIQLFTCESVFVLGLKRRKFFILRLACSVAMCFFAGWVYITLIKLIPNSANEWRIPYYILLFALSMLGIFISFDVKITGVLFAGTGGYSAQHMTWLFVGTFRRYFGELNSNVWFDWIIIRIVPYIIMTATVFFIFLRKNYKEEFIEKLNLRNILLALIAILIMIVFSVIGTNGDNYIARNLRSLIAIVVCILVIVLQNNYNKQSRLVQENIIMEKLLSEKKEQQFVSKENLEIINIKFHDIKQQLNALKSISNDEKRNLFIEELEEAMLVCDTMVETGNETLDIVLNEKSLFCEKNNIKFTYLINGVNLGFMKAIDIYALFSNALANAIENELKESDEEKRIITLHCRSDDGFVYVSIENYCSETPKFIEGLPVTTKEDSTIHGYGTKSIKHIVKKYGGYVKMHVQKDMFILEMLFRKRD